MEKNANAAVSLSEETCSKLSVYFVMLQASAPLHFKQVAFGDWSAGLQKSSMLLLLVAASSVLFAAFFVHLIARASSVCGKSWGVV